MQKKENLIKLIEIIDKIIKEETDSWFSNQLLSKIETSTDFKNISNHSIIGEIHEYCIQEILKQQAIEFYKDFPIKEIKDSLIKDFIKMEHERRKDDFINFSLAMYQQIENIVNYLFDKHNLIEKFEQDKGQIFSFKENYYEDDGRVQISNPSLSQIIFRKRLASSLKPKNFRHKLRLVLYYFRFKYDFKNTYTFNELTNKCMKIHTLRNCSHRGTPQYQNQQDTIDELNKNKSSSYFYFYSSFYEFVTGLTDSLNNNSNL